MWYSVFIKTGIQAPDEGTTEGPEKLLENYDLGKVLMNSSTTSIRKCEDR